MKIIKNTLNFNAKMEKNRKPQRKKGKTKQQQTAKLNEVTV